MDFDPKEHPHRRYDPLSDTWVLISPHRTKRPWQGAFEATVEVRPSYDPDCYLCPRNERAEGHLNPAYDGTFVFQNDFSALTVQPVLGGGKGLFQSVPVTGECRVVCFSPRHDLSLADMGGGEIQGVVDVWCEQSRELGEKWTWVQVFENKGAAMGCSNPHPHGQIWAGDWVPELVGRECRTQGEYWSVNGRELLGDVVQEEMKDGSRAVVLNEDWLVVVPFWAQWPFETLVLPRFPVQRMPELLEAQRASLAEVLQELLVRYDNLFETSFPYSMGWHGAPFDGKDHPEWRLHAHFYPPLLRSATVKKFMVGYEMLAEAQRDLTAEQAAERLRTVSGVHYRLA